jgi:hypothetical protein
MSMEQIVRPFVLVESDPLQRVVPRPETDLEALPEAAIEWGDGSRFMIPPNVTTPPDLIGDWEFPIEDAELGGGVIVNLPGQFFWEEDHLLPEDDEAPETEAIWDEVSRATSTIRVFNPQDENQWVDVERIDSLIMRGPDSRQHVFRFRNPPPPPPSPSIGT